MSTILFTPSSLIGSQALPTPPVPTTQVSQMVPMPITQSSQVLPAGPASQIMQPLVLPVYQPVFISQPLQQQPIMPPAPPRPLTPSPTYDKFIPPTPTPGCLHQDAPGKIYRFYQQIPVYEIMTTPTQVVDAPQFSTLTYN